jgi:Family of unknown function (DUF6502)
MTTEEEPEKNLDDPIKDATLIALKRLLEPLLELMLDTGVTVHEFNKTVREQAVRVATRRVIKETARASKSRVSIITGLSRSEVGKILNSLDSAVKTKPDQHPARRVLAAWFDTPYFAAPNGEPATLPIFGRKRSFERLVEKHGGGIPVRAMLDELTQMNAVEHLADQRVRAKARLPISTGMTSRSIAGVGERGKDLLDTLAHNVRRSTHPLFEATALIDDADPDMVSLVRREISEQGTNFINGATSLLNRSRTKRGSKTPDSSKNVRLGVTVFYFQDVIPGTTESGKATGQRQRKNLKRQK